MAMRSAWWRSMAALPVLAAGLAAARAAPVDHRLRLRTPPGRTMSYSNTGYALFGMVIEAVTGGIAASERGTLVLRLGA
jgi:CubicO group peptidase (beta-lactamase class C family)